MSIVVCLAFACMITYKVVLSKCFSLSYSISDVSSNFKYYFNFSLYVRDLKHIRRFIVENRQMSPLDLPHTIIMRDLKLPLFQPATKSWQVSM